MRRTTVALPEDLAAALDAEAAATGASASELVREGVVLRLAVAAAVRTQEAGQAVTLADVVNALRT